MRIFSQLKENSSFRASPLQKGTCLPHPLEAKIHALRSRARWLTAIYGLCWMLASVIAAGVALGLADYLIHFQDQGIRAISSAVLWGVLGWTCLSYVLLPLRHRLQDVQMAQRIQRRFPELEDRLASSIEFLGQEESDPEAGSAALRRAVIVSTSADVDRLNLGDALEVRPARRALLGAGVSCLVAAAIVAADPVSARLAAARLVKPFGPETWPQVHQLEFRNPPHRIALGQPFEVELTDAGGHLPEQVRIHYRYQRAGDEAEQSELMRHIGNVMVARKDNVTRPFEYRAEGGDDRSMEWITLEVVEPPRVESLKLKLHPPTYTGWPVESSQRNIQALRGTRVEVLGTTTKSLSSAFFRQENGASIAMERTPDNYGFRIAADAPEAILIDTSGAYWFELTDSQGLQGGRDDRWEIRALADTPPTASIDVPSENVFVTPDASLPLKITAKDDLALRHVGLKFARSDRTGEDEGQIDLFSADAAESVRRDKPPAGASDVRTVEHQWELAALGLKAGAQLNFYATATDYLPQTGRSPLRRLTIITPRELDERIAQRHSLILAELGRVLKMQQESRAQTQALEIQLRDVGPWSKQDVDHAQGAELNQRQVTRTLTSHSEGIPTQIDQLLAELASNRVDNPEVQLRMQSMAEEIDRLEKEHLGAIQQDLTSAIKEAQAKLSANSSDDPGGSDGGRVGPAVASAGQHQDAVIASLEKMLNSLAQWDTYRRFGRDVGQLRREQQELEQSTAQLGDKTLAKDLKELEPQQQADLKKLSSRQMELARSFEKVMQQMQSMEQRLQDADPLAATTLADALEEGLQRAIGQRMSESGGQIEKNQVGQALQQQQRVLHDLDDLGDILAGRREVHLGRLVKKLRAAEQQLAALGTRQEALRKKIQSAAEKRDSEERRQQLERLARQEREAEQDAARLARQLQLLQAERAARSIAGAAGKMARSGQAGEENNVGEADDQAGAAQTDLDDAQQQLAERRREAEADLAQEQLERLTDALKNLQERERQVLAETARLQAARDDKGKLSSAQDESLKQLARQQKSLREDTRSHGEKLDAAQVFALALTRAAEQMALAGEALERQDTGKSATVPEQNALQRLAQILEALSAAPQNAKKEEQQQGDPGGQTQTAQKQATHALAELKLLKLLQQEINVRFEKAANAGDLSSEDRAEQMAQLSQEQGLLAELASRLSQPAESNPEDDPNSLPDVREPKPGREDSSLLPEGP